MLTEVLSGTHYNQLADIYSYGVSFFEVLTCIKPFSNKKEEINNPFQLVTALTNGLRPEPLPREPKKVMTLISNCWQTDPNMRPSAKEVSEELKTITKQRYQMIY